MTEASRVQKMLTEQNEWIDRLKSQIMRLELDIVGYRVRNKQLEAALRKIKDLHDQPGPEDEQVIIIRDDMTYFIVCEALEGKDDVD